jgi:hypothetical protein
MSSLMAMCKDISLIMQTLNAGPWELMDIECKFYARLRTMADPFGVENLERVLAAGVVEMDSLFPEHKFPFMQTSVDHTRRQVGSHLC